MIRRCIIWMFLFLGLLNTMPCLAQYQIFIHNENNVYIENRDTTTFFQNTQVDGEVESNYSSKCLFLGENWFNDTSASFPGNGWFVFLQSNNLGYNKTQNLGGINWNNRFPNISLSNPNDLHLFSLSGNKDTFEFDTGCVFHNKNDFIIGNNNPGYILNYDENHYFITNHNQTQDSGFLVREAIENSAIDFPVGVDKNDYTPARISNSGTKDTFFVRVFDNVYEHGNFGNLVNDVTVAKTWNILENTHGGSSVNLTLQHNANSEGSSYTRSSQYVSRYFGSLNSAYQDTSLYSEWDYASASNSYGNSAGTITTAANYGYMATRSLPITSNFSRNSPTRYFTKASSTFPIPISLLNFTAKWTNTEMNVAKIEWKTAFEFNNHYFKLYRSFDGENFELIDVIYSKAPGGHSNEILSYDLLDDKIPKSIQTIYYRLEQVDFDESNEFFGPIDLFRKAANSSVIWSVYPNPSIGEIFVELSNVHSYDIKAEVFNALGQIVYNSVLKNNVEQNHLLNLTYLSSGYYILKMTIESPNPLILKPKRILINH